MRVLLLTVALACSAAAQVAPAPAIFVVDENGVAVPSARVTLQTPPDPAARCQTDHAGRCQFPNLAPGQYQLHVEKEGFYALDQPQVQVTPNATVEVAISHQQEVHEVVDVHESPLAIDPAQVGSQETISGVDIINIVYPVAHDYRNAINFIPGVVQDQYGQPHVAGAQTYQTVTLLDGFNVTQPANGLLLVRVSTDAFRSIQVEPSREPAEAGKGAGGVLYLNTGIGDDHFRFWATNFLPSMQNKHGWRFDQFLPLFTFSGPIVKRKIWFYNAFDGEYDNTIYTALPVGQDNDRTLRIGNLTKLQANISSRNILTTSFLLNHLNDQYTFLSPQSPQLTNPRDVEDAYVAAIKDQHYFASGLLVENGFAFSQYNAAFVPYGKAAYYVNTQTAGGNYYLADQTYATRWQFLSNIYIPPQQWHGRHDFKVGIDLDRISYEAQFNRRPISYLVGNNGLDSPDECATPNPNCTRYVTFSPAPLHGQYNAEVSAYAEDRWSITNRFLLEPGIRLDWDDIVRNFNLAPRLAGTYVLDNSGSTKLSAGIGLVYDATPVFLIARPFAGTREDTFYSLGPTCNPVCTAGPVDTRFTVNPNALVSPRFLNWSVGLEKKLPAAIYMKAEFFERHGARGFVYNTPANSVGGDFLLQNTRHDRYDAFQITLRKNFHETYALMGSYTRSRARSNQALDFDVDNPVLSTQQPGPYPWDTPNRFLSWGYLPFFKLPILHQTEIAYSMEARTGFPFNEVTDQRQLIGSPGDHRFPDYFSLNIQLEKRFHLFGYYLALRGGFDNLTGRCNPYVVNSVIVNSPDATVNHPSPTFTACQGRAFTSRIRFLGRK